MHKMLMKAVFAAMTATVVLPLAGASAETATIIRGDYGGSRLNGWAKYNCKRPASNPAVWTCTIYNEKLEARKGRPNYPDRTYHLRCEGATSGGVNGVRPSNIKYTVLHRRNATGSDCAWGAADGEYQKYGCYNKAPGKDFVFNIVVECDAK